MNDLWNHLHDLFDTDDGSLPEIRIVGLSSIGIEKIFALLRTSGRVLPENPTFWDNRDQQEIPIDSVPNAAHLVVNNDAQPFHFVVSGIMLADAIIPDIGIFVFQDQIVLDYRMGPVWGPQELSALFVLLCEIHQVDPSSTITLEEWIASEIRERFEAAVRNFLNTCGDQ